MWCSISFEAKIRDLCDGTQVANFLLKLEFLVETTTGSSQSTDDICGKFSETEPPSATLSPRDRCQTEPQKVLLAKVADKSFSQYVCGQTVITGVAQSFGALTTSERFALLEDWSNLRQAKFPGVVGCRSQLRSKFQCPFLRSLASVDTAGSYQWLSWSQAGPDARQKEFFGRSIAVLDERLKSS